MLPLLLASCTHPAATTAPRYASISIDLEIQRRSAIVATDSEFAEPPYSREQAFFILLNCNQFSPIRFGFDGDGISKTTVAFSTLTEQPDTAALFSDLTRRATPAGKLYGLCGLYLKDPNAFRKVLPPFMTSTEPVSIPYGGCIIGPKPTQQIVSSDTEPDIVHGTYPNNLIPLARRYMAKQAQRKNENPEPQSQNTSP